MEQLAVVEKWVKNEMLAELNNVRVKSEIFCVDDHNWIVYFVSGRFGEMRPCMCITRDYYVAKC